MGLKTKIFLYMLFLAVPLIISLAMLRYGAYTLRIMVGASRLLGISPAVLIPFMIIVLFILSLVFGALLVRDLVRYFLSKIMPKEEGV